MGTKNNPGRYDCYANAEPDEPVFVLLGRDEQAPSLVLNWAELRETMGEDPEMVAEARACARAMIEFRKGREQKVKTWSEARYWFETCLIELEKKYDARLTKMEKKIERLIDRRPQGMEETLRIDSPSGAQMAPPSKCATCDGTGRITDPDGVFERCHACRGIGLR